MNYYWGTFGFFYLNQALILDQAITVYLVKETCVSGVSFYQLFLLIKDF